MSLTPRQKHIARLVAKGLTNKQIAHSTGLSTETVNAHIKQAAERIDGPEYPRHKLLLWFLSLPNDDMAA